MSCQHCRGNPDRVNAPQEGDWGPEGCQGDPSHGDHPEPLAEPANIRTELARLQSDVATSFTVIEKLITAMELRGALVKAVSEHVLALDSNQKQMNVRLYKIEQHTDCSHNSK